MIYITDTLRISKVDDNCLQLEEFKEATSKKTGKSSKQWRWIGYYGNVKEACAGALRKQLFNLAGDTVKLSLEEVIRAIEEAESKIKNAKNQNL